MIEPPGRLYERAVTRRQVSALGAGPNQVSRWLAVAGGDIFGGQTGDWRTYLAKIQRGLQPYGFGYGPTWGQPGGFLGGPAEPPQWGTGAGAFGTGVTERWFGGRRGAAQEVLAAWAGGGQPLRVPRQIQQMLGMTDAEMMLMGYGRDPLGSWRAKPYQAPGDGGGGDGGGGDGGGGRGRGGGYGGYPSRGYYQPPGVGVGRISTRGTSRAVGYGTGLINWRI